MTAGGPAPPDPMSLILFSLWPLFALIVAGFVLNRRGFPGQGFWPGAERFNYFVLFPALLFNSLAVAPLNSASLPRLAATVLVTLSVCMGGLLLARRLRPWPVARWGVLVQGTLRFNTYMGLAAISALHGPAGLQIAAVVIAVLVPAVNVLSVLAFMTRGQTRARALILPVIRNPLILACVAGALFNLAGLEMKWGSERLLGLLAATSLPLGLLCVGAGLNPSELKGQMGSMCSNAAVRLLAVPAAAWLCARLLQLPATEAAVLVLIFALPTAPAAYVLTRQMAGDSHLMAGIITLQTAASALTLPLALLALR